MKIGVVPLSAYGISIPSDFIILCDMDGTLVDTDRANYLAYRRAIEEVIGRKFCFEFGNRLTRERLKELFPNMTDAQCQAIVSLKEQYYTEYLSETRLNRRLCSFVSRFRRTNEVMLVTLCRRKRVVQTLEYHNLQNFFCQILAREDLSPEGLSNKYAYVLRLLGANPARVVICENDRDDVKKAMLAGVPQENVVSFEFIN